MDNPVPTDTSASQAPAPTGTSDKPMDLDDDEDDQEALQAHIKKMGGDPSKADDVEAKSVKCTDVSRTPGAPHPRQEQSADRKGTLFFPHGSPSGSAARSLKTPRWSRSMPRNQDIPTLRNPQKRSVWESRAQRLSWLTTTTTITRTSSMGTCTEHFLVVRTIDRGRTKGKVGRFEKEARRETSQAGGR